MWALSIVVFISGTLLVLWAWRAVDTRATGDAIAREYIRAYSQAPDPSQAEATGHAAAAAVMTARHIDPNTVQIIAPDPAGFGRCRRVTVVVRITRPPVRLGPTTLGATTSEIRRSELTDPYRAQTALGAPVVQLDGSKPERGPCEY
jgi:hypothetical protein